MNIDTGVENIYIYTSEYMHAADSMTSSSLFGPLYSYHTLRVISISRNDMKAVLSRLPCTYGLLAWNKLRRASLL